MIDTTSSRELDLSIVGKVILDYMGPCGRDVLYGGTRSYLPYSSMLMGTLGSWLLL
jgi:hypothetical protein